MRILRSREMPDFEAEAVKKKIRSEVEQEEGSQPASRGPSNAAIRPRFAATFDPNINSPPVPYEILVKIMTYLPIKDLLLRAALVCKRWRCHTEDPELWRHVDLSKNHRMPKELVIQLLKTFGIRSINLDKYSYINSSIIWLIGQQAMLRSLKLDRCKKLSLALFQSISNCKWLECLSLTAVQILKDPALTLIALFCKNLIDLELRKCHEITTQSVKAVLINCTRLKHLKLINCPSVTSDDFLDCKHPIQLETLDISFCGKPFQVTFVHKLSKLKKLYASHIEGMNDDVVSKLSNLTALDVGACSITSDSILAILQNNPTLQELNILAIPVDDIDLAMISESPCRSTLRHLTFNWHDVSVTEYGIDRILRDCTQLEVLNAYAPCAFFFCAELVEEWRNNYPNVRFNFSKWHHMVLKF